MLKYAIGISTIALTLILTFCPTSFAEENATCQIPLHQPGIDEDTGDPADDPAVKIYSLSDALTYALRNNKYILAAKQDMLSAQAGKKSVRGQLLPHVYASMYLRNQEGLKDRELNGDYVTQAQNTRNVGVRQTIFDMPTFGRYSGSALEEERSHLYLQQVELEILYRAEKEFFALLSAKENVKSYKKAVERMHEQVWSAQAFYDKQMKPRLHVLQMQTQLAREESRLSRAENTVKTQRAKLISILSMSQDTPVVFTGDLENIQMCNLERLASYIDLAFKTRPDVLMKKKDTDISKKSEDIIEGKYYPTVSAFMEYEQKELDYAKRRYTDGNHETYSVGLNFRWDIFEGTSTHYSLMQQQNKTRSADLRYRKLKEEVASQVKQSYLDVIQNRKQIDLSRAYVNEAQETYLRADKRYKLGIGTSTELLDASRELIDSEVSLNTALSSYNTALAALYYSSGGFERLKALGMTEQAAEITSATTTEEPKEAPQAQ